LTQWHHGSIEVVLSNFILDELRRVLPRLSNRHGLTPAEIDDLVDILALQAEVVEPAAVLNDECRDVSFFSG
jgi:predicted nucleic acid-binding protein